MTFDEVKQNILVQVDPYLEVVLDRWEGLSSKDQYIVFGVSVFLSLMMIIGLVIYPVQRDKNAAMERYQSKQELYVWMQGAVPLIKHSNESAKAAVSSNQNMLQVINSTVGNYHLELQRFQPESETDIRVWMEDMPFNAIMSWLAQLESESKISVSSITIDAQKTEGLVDAKIILHGNF